MMDRPGRSRPGRGELAALVGILLVAAVLRSLFLVELAASPELDYPPVDSGFSLYWARGIATGDWELPPQAAGRDPLIRTSVYQRPPGYAYFLAGLYRLSGGRQVVIRGLQLGLGLISLVLAWRLGRRLFGPPVGLAWSALMATSWVFVYFDSGLHGAVLIVLLSLTLFTLLADLVVDPRPWRAAAVAAVVGLMALVRPNVLAVVPVLLVWGVVVVVRRGYRDRLARCAAAAMVAGSLVLAPAVIRNYRVSGDWVPVSGNAGFTAIMGNNDFANGTSNSRVAGLGLFTSTWQMQDLTARLGAEEGESLTFSEASRLLARRSRAWALADPVRTLRLYARKAALFWGPREIAHNRAVAVDRQESDVLRRLPGGFAATLAGALLGVALTVARRREGLSPVVTGGAETGPVAAAMGLFVLVWFASFLPFFVTSLYRVPVIPFLLLGGALAVVTVADLLRRRRWSGLVWLAVGLGLWAVLRVPLVEVPEGREKWHYLRGLAFSYQDRHQEAAAEFRSALAVAPGFGSAHNGLGAMLLAGGRPEEAEAHFAEALRLEPENPSAAFNLGLARAGLGRWSGAAEAFAATAELAPRNALAWANLGVAREQLGDLGAAAEAYEGSLRQAPGQITALNNLAWLRATAADEELRSCEQAVELGERLNRGRSDPGLLDTLAAGYAECGRFEEATATAQRALSLAATAAPEQAPGIEERLRLYVRGQPFRASP